MGLTFLGLFLDVVVVHLDAEDDATAGGRHQIREKQCPQNVGFVEQSLQHKGKASNGHHEEGWQSYAVCIACSNSGIGLGQIAHYHAD